MPIRSKDIQAMPAAMLRCTPLTSIDGEGGSFKKGDFRLSMDRAPLHGTSIGSR